MEINESVRLESVMYYCKRCGGRLLRCFKCKDMIVTQKIYCHKIGRRHYHYCGNCGDKIKHSPESN